MISSAPLLKVTTTVAQLVPRAVALRKDAPPVPSKPVTMPPPPPPKPVAQPPKKDDEYERFLKETGGF